MLFNKSIEEIKKLPMFFIVGSPRSGTTLLQQILDANPEVIIPLEARFITLLKARYLNVNNWTESVLEEFIEHLYNDIEFSKGWGVDKEKLKQVILSLPKDKITFQLLCKIVYLSYATIYEKNNIKIIGDKKPLNSLFVKELMEMFPEAFFIHIIRDYRAKIVSNRKWFARKKVSLLAYQWVIGNKEIDIQKAKYPRKFYTIRYEDLVVDSERYAKEIAAFLNVNYFPEMLNFHEKTSQEYAKSVSENDNQFQVNLLNTLHNNLLKPINTEKVDSWKSELTEKDVRLADYIAHEYALSYKYYPLYTSSSVILWIVKKWATVKVNLERLAIKLYHLTPDWIRFTTKSISMLLYKVFGFTHIYNPEFREEIKKKMAKK